VVQLGAGAGCGMAKLQHRRAAEFSLLFILLPLLLAWQGEAMRRWIIPQLLAFTALCLWLLLRDSGFDRRQLTAWPRACRPCLTRITAQLLVGGAAVLALVYGHGPPGVEPFALARERPLLWVAVLLCYPILSALPQELIFRVFFFHRYRVLFPAVWQRSLLSAAVFALSHLVLGNWVAPLLSLAGGLLFAYTYAKTGSLALVALEHGLWGNWLFTLGLGAYFYGGHI